MPEPKWESELADAAKDVRVEWSDARARRVEGMMLRRKARRAQVRAGAGVAVALLLGLGVAQWARTRPTTTAEKGPAPTASIAPVTFADGSTATPLAADAVVETKVAAADRVEVVLVKGAARFEITKNPQRTFRVTRGATLVEVLGTGFTVEPAPGGTQVTVHHGRVRVTCHGAASELALGDKTVCLDEAPPSPSAPVPVAPSASTSTSASASVAAVASVPAWRVLAHDGDYDKAWAALGSTTVKDEPGELLLAADVARLSRHAAQAVPHLRRVVDKFPGDPRAPLAAFTLGRVQMDDLGAPKDAAVSFAKARALGASGTLAEDALAREAEAWWRAGDAAKARVAAEDYVGKYPKGLRIKSVKKFGGLE